MKNRRGVALLITLSVVATMLALIGVAFGYLDNARTRASYKSALIESDYIFSKFANALRRSIGKKPTIETLSMFYSSPLSFGTKNNEFDMTFFCEPQSNRIPFAWLSKKGDKKYSREYDIAKRVFDEIVSKAEVKNPARLESMLVSAMSGKNGIRYGVESRVPQKKDIITQNLLIDILTDYRFLEDDDSVFKVDWESYFTYEEPDGKNRGKIDAEFAPVELMSIILDMDKSYLQEELKPGKLSEFMQNSGIDKKSYEWLFADKAVAEMVCTGRFGYAEHTYALKFDYRSGNIKGFEFVEEE